MRKNPVARIGVEGLTGTTSASPNPAPASTRKGSGHIGLVVLGAIAAGLVLGLLLVLGVFAGGAESEIIGSALLALGGGFTLLAVVSARRTSQSQQWAFAPGVLTMLAGLAVLVLAPGGRVLDLAGWAWPVLLALLVVSSFRGARRSLDNWSRRALLYPALFVLALIAIGGAVGTIAHAASSNPAPASGRTYLANGHRLYVSCVGSGSPTVVLFSGLGEWTPNWAWVQENVSRTTRVCAFDRAGEGWSGGNAVREDGHRLASDLHALLQTAHVPGPYLLAGHSVGGTYALVYAEQYPKQVAGLALIDSATPYQFDLSDYRSFYSTFKRASAVLPVAARTVMGRIALRSGFGLLPPRARDAARAFNSSPSQLTASRIEFLQLPTVFDQAKALHSLHGKPLAVLSASVGEMHGWAAAQNKLARLSTNSTHRTVAGASHAALLEDKRFATITSNAITQVVRRVRSSQR
jgi:pimeloyl-ACP methyl ester carboxylesterase